MVQGRGHKDQYQGHKRQSRRLRSKVIDQGHRVKVKVVWGVLYPIDSREVRHAGVFICLYVCFFECGDLLKETQHHSLLS